MSGTPKKKEEKKMRITEKRNAEYGNYKRGPLERRVELGKIAVKRNEKPNSDWDHDPGSEE